MYSECDKENIRFKGIDEMLLYVTGCANGTEHTVVYCFSSSVSVFANIILLLVTATKGSKLCQVKKQSFPISDIKIYIWLHHKQTINSFCSTSFFSFTFFLCLFIFLHKTTVKSTKEACWVLRMSKWEGECFFFFSFFVKTFFFYKKCAGYHGGTAVVRTQKTPNENHNIFKPDCK